MMRPVLLAALLAAAAIRPAAAQVPTCQLGAYVQSLGAFDVSDGSFAARAWIWSRCPERVGVLSHLDFVNAEEVELRFADSLRAERGGGDTLHYAYVQARGRFRHRWDVQNYPFDRHTLRLDLEHTLLDTASVRLVADRVASGLSPEMRLDGWRVAEARFVERPVTYPTTFGDPTVPNGSEATFDRVSVEVDLVRSGWLSFLKLTVGLYIAVGVALVTFWLRGSDGGAAGARMSLLVGALFAAFVNLTGATNVVGRTEQLTLIDLLHFSGMAVILAAVVLATLDASLAPETARARDRRQFLVLGVAFVLLHAVLIGHAWATG